jgi:D-hexose-6-phosphate mutarotase
MSPLAVDLPGKPIRGGVPICWPWFGKSPYDENFPSHGIARIASWELVEISETIYGETDIELKLSDQSLQTYPTYMGLGLTLKIALGESLKIQLVTANVSSKCIDYSEGLHTYFKVSNIEDIKISGLSGQKYLDLLNNNKETYGESIIKFSQETGRIYMDSESECSIEDAVYKRIIKVKKSGSKTTAIWNPWVSGSIKLDDMEPDCWRGMVCVESANAYDDFIKLNANESHILMAEYILQV